MLDLLGLRQRLAAQRDRAIVLSAPEERVGSGEAQERLTCPPP